MEARQVDALPKDGRWQFEPKWDGFRCLAFRDGQAVDLRAKSGKPLGRYFPDIVECLKKTRAKTFAVDGELVIPVGGKLSFEALQLRLHPAASRVRKLAAESPAKLILFDILGAAEDVTAKPLLERRALLEDLFAGLDDCEALRLSPFTRQRNIAARWLGRAGRGSLDGVVAKRLDAPYRCGERDMLKIKCLRTADCVVGGFRYAEGTDIVGSLLLGLFDADGKLDHVGFTSALSLDERKRLTRKLEALRGAPGFTGNAPGGPSRWSTARTGEWQPLKTKLVAEVQ